MAHIPLPEGLPGIVGPLLAYPEAGEHFNHLTQYLLRGPSTLTPGERELIGAYTSAQNECAFCTNVHGATAKHLLGGDAELVRAVLTDPETAPISDKMKALLAIAGKVAKSGRAVTEAHIARARQHGATDAELHHTVMIAALFCMANRYVDGLSTFTPEQPEAYDPIGAMLVEKGYVDALKAF